MSWTKKFVELDKTIHDRASFDCGEVALNQFIQTQAVKHMRTRISRTLVLPSTLPLPEGKYPICAFYTIAPSAINRKTLPEKLSKKLPYYPVPVFLLAQLAVHSSYKGHGLGKITLFKALEYFWQISKYMNAYAVIVDCLNKQAETFYAKYGFEKLSTFDDKLRMFLPMETVAKLFR